jgi:hypothetical protein
MDWSDATYVMMVATTYWARALYITDGGQSYEDSNYGGPCSPTNATPDANGLLYLILCVQPANTVAALAVTVWLHHVPLGTGFAPVTSPANPRPSLVQACQASPATRSLCTCIQRRRSGPTSRRSSAPMRSRPSSISFPRRARPENELSCTRARARSIGESGIGQNFRHGLSSKNGQRELMGFHLQYLIMTVIRLLSCETSRNRFNGEPR